MANLICPSAPHQSSFISSPPIKKRRLTITPPVRGSGLSCQGSILSRWGGSYRWVHVGCGSSCRGWLVSLAAASLVSGLARLVGGGLACLMGGVARLVSSGAPRLGLVHLVGGTLARLAGGSSDRLIGGGSPWLG